MTEDVLIQVNDLCRDYGSLHALKNVSFSLRRGEVLGFLGLNGAGKSTTMQIISGNLAPTSGEVKINGYDILEQPKQAKASLGFLAEQPPLYRELTVNEYLLFCARLNRIAKNDIAKAITRACERCGLNDVRKRLIGNLSKGYQQRVGIAQAIIHTPEVVILDEPTVGLDPIQIREIRQLIRELGNDHSVILCTHILPEVQSTCDRVLIINHGQIAVEDTLAGLDARVQKNSIRVRLNQPPKATQLNIADLNSTLNILNAEVLSEQEFTLQCGANFDQATFIQYCVQQDWDISELSPITNALEQMFINITCNDIDSPAATEVAS